MPYSYSDPKIDDTGEQKEPEDIRRAPSVKEKAPTEEYKVSPLCGRQEGREETRRKKEGEEEKRTKDQRAPQSEIRTMELCITLSTG